MEGTTLRPSQSTSLIGLPTDPHVSGWSSIHQGFRLSTKNVETLLRRFVDISFWQSYLTYFFFFRLRISLWTVKKIQLNSPQGYLFLSTGLACDSQALDPLGSRHKLSLFSHPEPKKHFPVTAPRNLKPSWVSVVAIETRAKLNSSSWSLKSYIKPGNGAVYCSFGKNKTFWCIYCKVTSHIRKGRCICVLLVSSAAYARRFSKRWTEMRAQHLTVASSSSYL